MHRSVRLTTRHGAVLAVVALAVVAACAARVAFGATPPPDVKYYKVNSQTTIQQWPAVNAPNLGTLSTGQSFPLDCQTYGLTKDGSNIWDQIYPQNGYVPDSHVSTGSGGFVAVKCDGRIEPARDDYPYGSFNGNNNLVDEWNFFRWQCTSFAAWRVRSRMGVAFHNYYKGPHWGDANNWDDAARAAGISVNSTPTKGSIAQWNYSPYGHVAYVAQVYSGGGIKVEEYNKGGSRSYGTRSISPGSPDWPSTFIHFRW